MLNLLSIVELWNDASGIGVGVFVVPNFQRQLAINGGMPNGRSKTLICMHGSNGSGRYGPKLVYYIFGILEQQGQTSYDA
jgi:hypothetical protein